MKTVSPWTATVAADLKKSKALAHKKVSGYYFEVHNTGDSLWIVTTWPKGGNIAFRAAFGLNSDFDSFTITEEADKLQLQYLTRLGSYVTEITFPESEHAILKYSTRLTLVVPTLIPFWPRDIVPLIEDGDTIDTSGTVHVLQIGARSGQLFFNMDNPATGSVFYIQNLGSLSDYCEAVKMPASDLVGGNWPEIGFQLPISDENALPSGKEFIVSDALVIFNESKPEDEIAIAEQFIESVAAAYLLLPKPDTHYNVWPEISVKTLNDLITNKGCWTYTEQHPYLNAFFADYDSHPEVMVQLAVMNAIAEYGSWAGKRYPVVDELREGLWAFYDEKLQTITRWLPSQRGNPEVPEEQKMPLTMESCYLHHPLMNLSNLALDGDKKCEKLLLQSIDYAIKVARHFNYQWPAFYKMDTLDTFEQESDTVEDREKDVAGGYLYLMMNMHRLTGDKKYLDEAEKVAKTMESVASDIFYQAGNMAFSALALLRLFKETGKEPYLKKSHLCIAAIFKNAQLWESNYGYSRHFPNFFGVFPLTEVPYKAAFAEMEVYAALNDYIREATAVDAPILPSLKLLLPEFVRYSVHRLPFYYPPLLPKEIVSEKATKGEINPNIWIPIEDLRDGWEKNGQIGQEVYGAGVGFGVAPRQYQRIKGERFQIFCDYPIAGFKVSNYKSAILNVLGDKRMKARFQIVSDLVISPPRFSVATVSGKEEIVLKPLQATAHLIEFEISGGDSLKIKWK